MRIGENARARASWMVVALLCSWGCDGGGAAPVGDCEPTECGPPPGAPAIECADGSAGGNTGRCLRGADGVCSWELRDCPAVSCRSDGVLCDGMPPECEAGQLAVVSEGCWTGACASVAMCEPANCDETQVTCERTPPTCPEGLAPVVQGDCWADVCVPTGLCAGCRATGCAAGSTCSACGLTTGFSWVCVPDGAAC